MPHSTTGPAHHSLGSFLGVPWSLRCGEGESHWEIAPPAFGFGGLGRGAGTREWIPGCVNSSTPLQPGSERTHPPLPSPRSPLQSAQCQGVCWSPSRHGARMAFPVGTCPTVLQGAGEPPKARGQGEGRRLPPPPTTAAFSEGLVSRRARRSSSDPALRQPGGVR